MAKAKTHARKSFLRKIKGQSKKVRVKATRVKN